MVDQGDEASQTLRGIAAMGIDWTTSSMRVVRSDGLATSEPLEPSPIWFKWDHHPNDIRPAHQSALSGDEPRRHD